MRVLGQQNKLSSLFLASRYLLQPLMDRSATDLANSITEYLKISGGRWPSWSIGGPNVGHMASLVHKDLMPVCSILLFTLPGTPFTTYGDEIGLEDLVGQTANAIMHWDDTENFGFSTHALPAEQATLNRNISVNSQKDDEHSLLSLYKKLSKLKQKEGPLLHGIFRPLPVQPDSKIFAYMRVWNQNESILVALNLDSKSAKLALQDQKLPADATWVLSTDPPYEARSLEVETLELGPLEGVVMKFPTDLRL